MINEKNSQMGFPESMNPPATRGSFNEHWNKSTHHGQKGERELSDHSQTILNLLTNAQPAHVADWCTDLTDQLAESDGANSSNSGTPYTALEPTTLADQSPVEELAEGPSRTLLDPSVAEACRILSALIDQNVCRLHIESRRAVEVKDFNQFEGARQLIDELSALKVYVNITYAHMATAKH